MLYWKSLNYSKLEIRYSDLQDRYSEYYLTEVGFQRNLENCLDNKNAW